MITNIYDTSDPEQVSNKLHRIFGPDFVLYFSTHKDKKYMILNPYTNKFIHFGASGMTDYTKHRDKERQRRFKLRNHKWEKSDPFTPAFLSYHLLW